MATIISGTTGIDTDGLAVDTNTIYVDATNDRVGIGTASPSGKLHVNAGANYGSVFLQAVNGTDVKFTSGSTMLASIAADSASGASPSLIFRTSSADTERMRINSDGSLLINTTSNIAISSRSVNMQFLQNNDVKESITIRANSSSYNFASINFLNHSASQVGYIYMTSSATQYSTSSDYRLKENIAPMTGALNKVIALKPVTYTWKVDGSDGQGFIAHELQEVVPDCVTGEKDAVDADGNPVYQGVDTSFLVATLVAAIQELTARIEVLESK